MTMRATVAKGKGGTGPGVPGNAPALVPSLNALLFLLPTFGFHNLHVMGPGPDDYEQFQRGVRVVAYGSKGES